MKNKKATHVGVILSFVIFVGFILFLLIIISPSLKTDNSKENTLTYLSKNIKNKTSGEVITFLVEDFKIKSCGVIDEAEFDLGEMNFTVKDPEGNLIASNRSNNKIYLDKKPKIGFYKIYYSPEELNYYEISNTEDCEPLNISSMRKDKKIIEAKIIKMLEEYNESYSVLKDELNVASNEDFGIRFEYENGTTLGEEIPDVKKDIFSRKVQITYLDINADTKIGNFIIYVW